MKCVYGTMKLPFGQTDLTFIVCCYKMGLGDIIGGCIMFSLFTKKAINEDAAKSFWAWFEEKEEWVINCIANHDSAFVWAIDERLKPVFPYFKGELEFQLGYNNEVGEFFFFHFGKKELIRDGETLGKLMPAEIAKRWQFILDK